MISNNSVLGIISKHLGRQMSKLLKWFLHRNYRILELKGILDTIWCNDLILEANSLRPEKLSDVGAYVV